MATLAELQAELAEIKTALEHIRKGGQSYTITSGSGGTSRTVTLADYDTLMKHKLELDWKIENKNETRAVKLRIGW